jgi:hypothetical protein
MKMEFLKRGRAQEKNMAFYHILVDYPKSCEIILIF